MAWKHWFLQLLIAIDQLINVLLTPGSRGTFADETLSSRAWRASVEAKLWGQFWVPVIDFLFALFEKDHCRKAYEAERKRLQSPPEHRNVN